MTEVELIWVEGEIQHWIRFGDDRDLRILDRRRRIVGFLPGAVFGFVRWQANTYGTVISKLDILRAVEPGMAVSTIPGIHPGGELLLHLSGWSRVERALRAIDAVEALGIDPEDVAPDHWRHLHNRLTAGLKPRAYSKERHRAWLKRREIET
jgi:hypothetical protein